jgi:hypothetical protein
LRIVAVVAVVEKARREKALDFSGCNSRPVAEGPHPASMF